MEHILYEVSTCIPQTIVYIDFKQFFGIQVYRTYTTASLRVIQATKVHCTNYSTVEWILTTLIFGGSQG